jgi:hypothetical protein
MTTNPCLGSKHSSVVYAKTKGDLIMNEMFVYDVLANGVYQYGGMYCVCETILRGKQNHNSIANDASYLAMEGISAPHYTPYEC